LILIEGIALIIIGLLLLSQPGMSSVILVQVLGIYWLIMGIVRIISIFIDSAQWGWKLIAGALGIIAGFIVIQHPLWSTVLVANTVIIILGLTGIVIGIVSLFQAFKGAGWGTGILGIISIILGIVLLANIWLLSFSLPVTLGILAVIGGIVAIFGAFRARREEHELTSRAAPEIDLDAVETPEEEAPTEPEEEPEPSVAEEPVVEEPEPPAAEEPAAETPELDHHALQFVEGIGPAFAEKLATIGIVSTETLLERGATPKGRSDIADESGISGKLILTWVNHADLMRIKGIGSQFADLLEEAGVDTIPDLARRNAANLYEKIVSVNEEKKLVRHTPPQEHVEDWVAMAKELPRIIEY
jgi:uncharacterized membrane protein HdeD (DUF308 family)